MTNSRQLRNVQPVGGRSAQKPGRKLELEVKLFANTDQAVPIRIIHGRDEVAGVHIFPVWGMRSEEIEAEAGK